MGIRLVKNEKLNFLDALYILQFFQLTLCSCQKMGDHQTSALKYIFLLVSGNFSIARITQHSAWHFHIMFLQKLFFNFSFANLSQHPTDSFLNQVIFVIEQNFGIFLSIIKFILSDKIKSGDDGYSALPQVISINQTLKQCFVFLVQIRTYNITSRNIYNVPVIYKFDIIQIQIIN